MKKWRQLPFGKFLSLSIIVGLCLILSGCQNILTAENIQKFTGYSLGGLAVAGGLANAADSCWSCSVFMIAWNAIGETVENSYSVTTKLARILLGAGLLFWITLTIGKMVASIKEPNMKDFIPKVVGVLFKAMIVGVVLINPTNTKEIVAIIMEPILMATLEISQLVLPKDMDTESTILSVLSWFSMPGASLQNMVGDLLNSAKIADHQIFTKEIGTKLNDVVYGLYLTFKGGFVLGSTMLVSMSFMSIVSGLMIMAVFFYFMFFFPLLLIEGFLTLGVILVLVPFFMAGWVFPSTKQYMSEFFKMVFQSIAQLLITCIYITVIVTIIDSYQDTFSTARFLSDPSLVTGITNMSNSGLAFCGMIFCLVKLTNDIPNITSYFVGEMNKSIIARTFSQMQKVIANAAKMTVGAALAGTGAMAGVGKAMMASGARDSIRSARNLESDESAASSTAQQRAETQGRSQ